MFSMLEPSVQPLCLCFSSVYLCVCVSGVGICTGDCGVRGGQKRPSDARELKSQVTMDCLTVVVGNTLGSSLRVVSALTCEACIPASYFSFLVGTIYPTHIQHSSTQSHSLICCIFIFPQLK